MSNGRNHTTFQAGGQVYNLRISYNALAEYQKVATIDDFKVRSLPAVRALIWAGINAYGNTSVTIEQAGDICEAFVEERGLEALGNEADRILRSGVWLGSTIKKFGGTDTGNPKPAIDTTPAIPLVSDNSLKITSDSPTE